MLGIVCLRYKLVTKNQMKKIDQKPNTPFLKEFENLKMLQSVADFKLKMANEQFTNNLEFSTRKMKSSLNSFINNADESYI